MHLTYIHLEVTPFFVLLLHSFEAYYAFIGSYFYRFDTTRRGRLLSVIKMISEIIIEGHHIYVQAVLERWNVGVCNIMWRYQKHLIMYRLPCMPPHMDIDCNPLPPDHQLQEFNNQSDVHSPIHIYLAWCHQFCCTVQLQTVQNIWNHFLYNANTLRILQSCTKPSIWSSYWRS